MCAVYIGFERAIFSKPFKCTTYVFQSSTFLLLTFWCVKHLREKFVVGDEYKQKPSGLNGIVWNILSKKTDELAGKKQHL